MYVYFVDVGVCLWVCNVCVLHTCLSVCIHMMAHMAQ